MKSKNLINLILWRDVISVCMYLIAFIPLMVYLLFAFFDWLPIEMSVIGNLVVFSVLVLVCGMLSRIYINGQLKKNR